MLGDVALCPLEFFQKAGLQRDAAGLLGQPEGASGILDDLDSFDA